MATIRFDDLKLQLRQSILRIADVSISEADALLAESIGQAERLLAEHADSPDFARIAKNIQLQVQTDAVAAMLRIDAARAREVQALITGSLQTLASIALGALAQARPADGGAA